MFKTIPQYSTTYFSFLFSCNTNRPADLFEHNTLLSMSDSMDRSAGIGFRCVTDVDDSSKCPWQVCESVCVCLCDRWGWVGVHSIKGHTTTYTCSHKYTSWTVIVLAMVLAMVGNSITLRPQAHQPNHIQTCRSVGNSFNLFRVFMISRNMERTIGSTLDFQMF